MFDIQSLVKEYMNSVYKSAEFFDILICNNKMVIDVADSAIATIDIPVDTGIVTAFRYPNYDQNNIDFGIYNKVSYICNYYTELAMHSPLVAELPDVRSDEKFMEILSRKASDGVGFYKLNGIDIKDRYIIPIFSGFPILNKEDSMDMFVREIDHQTVMVQYVITKKKINQKFSIFYRAMNMNRLEPWRHII